MRRIPVARRTSTVAVALALSLGALGACTPGDRADAEPTPTSTPVETPSPGPEPEPEPGPESQPDPEAEPEAEHIVLSAAGVGDIAMGTADPLGALEALLGPAEHEWNDVECGPGNVDAYQWGALSVSIHEGALWGWDIQPRRGALPADVVVESGVTPVQPLSDALALPGATTPEYMANVDVLYVEAGGVSYFGQGSDPATSLIELVGVNVIICG